MRTLFWILLLANVAFFAVMQRGGLGWGEQPYQPQPALHAEMIRLLDTKQGAPFKAMHDPAKATAQASAPAQLAASAPVSASAVSAVSADHPVRMDNPSPETSTNQAASQIPAAIPAQVVVKQNSLSCLEWGDFSGTDLKRATEALSTLRLGDKLSKRQIEYDRGYWIYMPPQQNLAGANRKVSQLKALGIKEYFIVHEAGAFRYAISLGVFKTKDAAKKYFKVLRSQGVRTAKIGQRASKLITTMFMLDRVDVSIEDKLSEIKKDFPGSELKNVPCTLTR